MYMEAISARMEGSVNCATSIFFSRIIKQRVCLYLILRITFKLFILTRLGYVRLKHFQTIIIAVQVISIYVGVPVTLNLASYDRH